MPYIKIEAHCLDESRERYQKEFDIAIVDESDAPWSIIFHGTEHNLRCMLKDGWGGPAEYGEVTFYKTLEEAKGK